MIKWKSPPETPKVLPPEIDTADITLTDETENVVYETYTTDLLKPVTIIKRGGFDYHFHRTELALKHAHHVYVRDHN